MLALRGYAPAMPSFYAAGSLLEGGGQILRLSAALAAVTCQSVEVHSIRKGRSRPGLAAQHLTGLQLVVALSRASLAGGRVGSTHITLQPSGLVAGNYTADTHTAGSCTLLAQAALPCLLFASHTPSPHAAPSPASTPSPLTLRPPSAHAEEYAMHGGGMLGQAPAGQPIAPQAHHQQQQQDPAMQQQEQRQNGGEDGEGGGASGWRISQGGVSRLELRGGTDAAMAPPASYLQHVLAPLMRRLGLAPDLKVTLLSRGFYPKGGGVVVVQGSALAPGHRLPPFTLADQGQVLTLHVRAFAAGRQPPVRADVLARAAAAALASGCAAHQLGSPVLAALLLVEGVEEALGKASGEGWGLSITATTSTGCILGANVVGEKGLLPEVAAHACATELLEVLQAGACVDQWMQDQLIVFMALAAGDSHLVCLEPTLHARTAIAVAEQLTSARFSITRQAGGSARWHIRCKGCGWAR
ncbi:hypothetical protein QJQ45_000298 [Haematococcus lacustris]|nr:hypothetical protein QJQ45_000298 [Haematococcus lacustris]